MEKYKSINIKAKPNIIVKYLLMHANLIRTTYEYLLSFFIPESIRFLSFSFMSLCSVSAVQGTLLFLSLPINFKYMSIFYSLLTIFPRNPSTMCGLVIPHYFIIHWLSADVFFALSNYDILWNFKYTFVFAKIRITLKL